MTMIALFVASAALAPALPVTAIDAERAFAADAQKVGQWKSFRQWSTDDAVMFVPQPVNAHAFLNDRKEPAEAVKWAPSASFVSCDGSMAVNTGPWTRNGGKSVGYFTTVWKRQPGGGWRWAYDGGDQLTVPRPLPSKPAQRVADCRATKQLASPAIVRPAGAKAPTSAGYGRSTDGTLFYSWRVTPAGAREFSAYLWNGKRFDKVVDDRIAAAPK